MLDLTTLIQPDREVCSFFASSYSYPAQSVFLEFLHNLLSGVTSVSSKVMWRWSDMETFSETFHNLILVPTLPEASENPRTSSRTEFLNMGLRPFQAKEWSSWVLQGLLSSIPSTKRGNAKTAENFSVFAQFVTTSKYMKSQKYSKNNYLFKSNSYIWRAGLSNYGLFL